VRRYLVIAVALLTLLALAVPVAAITKGGVADDNEHPYVGLMVAYDTPDYLYDEEGNPEDINGSGGIESVLYPTGDLVHQPLWRCSGTLINENVYVTAGHCTEEPAVKAAVWFAEDVQSGIPENGYPYLEFGVEAGQAYAGDPYTHPDYNPDAFFLYDLGVVQLDEDGFNPGSFAALPSAGAIDEMGKGRKRSVIEAVGYGLQDIRPVEVAERIRLKADLKVVNTKGVAGIGSIPGSNSVLVSGDAKHGGTCFGDSGGPMFIGTDSGVIGAVTSFGLNGNCAGVGGGFRIDRQFELNWINTFSEESESTE
jgi:hypothetical protein